MGVRGKGYTDSIPFSMLYQSVLKFTHEPIRNFNIPPGSPGAFTLLNTGLCSGRRQVVSLQSIEHFDAISMIDKGAECGKLLSICF